MEVYMNSRVLPNTFAGWHFRLEYRTVGCGGYLKKRRGVITSPNYPNRYPTKTVSSDTICLQLFYTVTVLKSLQKYENWLELINFPSMQGCQWIIRAPRDQVIELVVDYLDLEPHSSCSYDYLRIMVGNDIITNLCYGTSEKAHSKYNYTSYSNEMTIIFRSDVNVVGKGFHAAYRMKPKSKLRSYRRKSCRCVCVLTLLLIYKSKRAFLKSDRF